MIKMIKDTMVFIFGEKKKGRFTKIMLFLGLAISGIILFLNVSCGYNKAGFYFEFAPGMDIQIKKELK